MAPPMPLEAAGWRMVVVGVYLGMCHRDGLRFHPGAFSGINSDERSFRLRS